MHPNQKSFLYSSNPGPPMTTTTTTPTYSNYNALHNPNHRAAAVPPEFEQRVPSAINQGLLPAAHHHDRQYNNIDYSGLTASTAAAASYPPKSYLSSTMICIPKSASYYAGAPVQDISQRHSHSFDSYVPQLPTAAAGQHVPPKFLDTKSMQKMNCFPKQRFSPYTGRLMTAQPPLPTQMPPQQQPPIYSGPPQLAPTVNNAPAQVVAAAAAAAAAQQVPVPTYGMGHAMTLSSHYSSNGLNVSASSFNISKIDLDSSSAECPEPYPGMAKIDGDTSASSSMGNVSGGSSSGGGTFNASGCRNDSGIGGGGGGGGGTGVDLQKKVMLQLNNLDSSYDEAALKKFLISLLKPITPIVSLIIDGTSSAKIEVPSPHFAKSVISQLHRKKIGRKRMLVSYCKETINDISTLGYQIAGLLKDVPFYTLPLNKFRELFQARFKASISVLELYKMVDVCHIRTDETEEKHIHLNQAFLAKIEQSPFNPNLQHSIPYCARHFKRENYKGWAEQELEPLPYVFLTVNQVQNIVYRLMQTHKDGIPVASILHCIEACLNVSVPANENGISLEHLLSCVKGAQIENNVYGIKIIGLAKANEKRPGIDIYDAGDSLFYSSNSYTLTPAQSLAKEVIELLKICPKSTMNFSKFVPAYHNYFGKQCRVADYGYTKLIELFEGMSSIIQVLGEGNNRHITLTHRIQVRRFTNDLMKTIKWQVNKSVLLSKLPHLLAFTLNHTFSITDYGVCSLNDMLEELESNGAIATERLAVGQDMLISLPKHKQSRQEMEKTAIFAGEIVELLRSLPHYEILFQKFVKSYFYYFGFHCRLSDYGFQKLADLFETVEGLIKLDPSNDENRKLNLSPIVARRIFADQLSEIVSIYSKRKNIQVPLVDVVNLFRNKFGYSMIPQTLGCNTIDEMMRCLPFIEINESEKDFFIISHTNDEEFRKKSLMVCLLFMHLGTDSILYSEFFPLFYQKFNEYLTEPYILAMKHVIEIRVSNGLEIVVLSDLIKFILWVVCRLDAKTPTNIKTLKYQMNIQIGTCFPMGFPNLSTLFAAFPEIFQINGKAHENSDVLLQPQFFITKQDIQKYFYTLKKQADQIVPSSRATVHQQVPPSVVPLGIANQSLPPLMAPEYLSRMYPLDFKEGMDYKSVAGSNAELVPVYAQQANPNATYYVQRSALAGQLQGVGDSHQKVNSAVATSPKVVSKWIKGVKRDFLPLSIRSMLYEPPKPDTPPSKLWPFGFDPIWSEDICSPPIDISHITLPFIPPGTPPIVITPDHLKIINYKCFDFDAAYRDLIGKI